MGYFGKKISFALFDLSEIFRDNFPWKCLSVRWIRNWAYRQRQMTSTHLGLATSGPILHLSSAMMRSWLSRRGGNQVWNYYIWKIFFSILAATMNSHRVHH